MAIKKLQPERDQTDCILEMMTRQRVPLTRENYLFLAYWDPSRELDAEAEAGLPIQFQIGRPNSVD
jgi:hypothetical protein